MPRPSQSCPWASPACLASRKWTKREAGRSGRSDYDALRACLFTPAVVANSSMLAKPTTDCDAVRPVVVPRQVLISLVLCDLAGLDCGVQMPFELLAVGLFPLLLPGRPRLVTRRLNRRAYGVLILIEDFGNARYKIVEEGALVRRRLLVLGCGLLRDDGATRDAQRNEPRQGPDNKKYPPLHSVILLRGSTRPAVPAWSLLFVPTLRPVKDNNATASHRVSTSTLSSPERDLPQNPLSRNAAANTCNNSTTIANRKRHLTDFVVRN